MDNLDQSEIQKFDAQANKWWDENGAFRTLHDINPLRLRFITQQVAVENKAIIDIGCGGGILSEALAKAGGNVTGIDLAEATLEVAKSHGTYTQLNIDYQVITAEDKAKKNPAAFDVVTCMELLEHVPDPESLVKACATLVKPGGHVFFSTINRTLKAYLMAVVGGEYILNLIPKGTHHYDKFIKPSELEQWLREAGLTLKVLKGMHYNPITHVPRLSSDVSVNYLLHCIKEA